MFGCWKVFRQCESAWNVVATQQHQQQQHQQQQQHRLIEKPWPILLWKQQPRRKIGTEEKKNYSWITWSFQRKLPARSLIVNQVGRSVGRSLGPRRPFNGCVDPVPDSKEPSLLSSFCFFFLSSFCFFFFFYFFAVEQRWERGGPFSLSASPSTLRGRCRCTGSVQWSPEQQHGSKNPVQAP